MGKTLEKKAPSQKEEFRKIVLEDFKLATISRETSLLGRREVLTGKAKFGIFGDGKEVAQIAWAKAVKKGDFRSGYYRDQTFMMAIGKLSIEQFFSGLYGTTDINQDPMSAGRQMGGHFTTHSLDDNFNWKNLCFSDVDCCHFCGTFKYKKHNNWRIYHGCISRFFGTYYC